MTTAEHPVRFLSLWSINAPLDEKRLFRQLDAMRNDGLDGVVFHPRFYPNVPPYLSEDYLRIVSRVILHARDLGMTVWLYDENGWPSGIANGEVLRRWPEEAATLLTLHEGDAPDAWHSFVHGGRRWHLRRAPAKGIDYLNPSACRHFLEQVHDRYRDGLEPDAWDHVEAIFTDEPEFGLGLAVDAIPPHGAIMWSSRLADHYAAQFGCDVREDLPAVFFPHPDGAHASVRIRFWEFMTDRLCEGFFAPYQAWCRREGKIFTGHLKGDEHPLFQVMMNGSCHQVFQYFDMPGIDPLERFPSCDFFARQVVSAARQFGNGRAMAEVMGGGGWGSRPEDLERFLLWLANHGVTDHVIHINQYRLSSHAIRDWPPSNPGGMNWRDAYPEILRRVRAQACSTAAVHAETLVVAPYRAIMAGYEPWSLPLSNIHNCAVYPDTAAGRVNDEFLNLLPRLPAGHHFVDERSFDGHGRLAAGKIIVGNHAYSTLVLASGCQLRPAGRRLLDNWTAAGGTVLAPDALPPVEITSPPAPTGVAVAVQWERTEVSENVLLLEPCRQPNGSWTCSFELKAGGGNGWALDFADDVHTVSMDENTLKGQSTEEGTRVELPVLTAGRHTLRFQKDDDDEGPVFVWLTGPFRVLSQSEWTPMADGMLRTAGPWVVVDDTNVPVAPDAERVATGWPFAHGPFRFEGSFRLGESLPAGTRLVLRDAMADAVRMFVDDTDMGWVWGPDGSAPLPNAVNPGVHRLTLHLVPSTYNRYGPHHHRDGDRHVVSCDQFTGRKNFADHPDAPPQTHDANWRFRPVQPPRRLEWV